MQYTCICMIYIEKASEYCTNVSILTTMKIISKFNLPRSSLIAYTGVILCSLIPLHAYAKRGLLCGREQLFGNFYWGGGGQEDFGKKKLAVISGEKFSGPNDRQKIIRPALGSASALPNLFSHSKICLSQSEICFLHSVHCFTHSENHIIYFGNDISHYKKEVFCSLKIVSCT